MDSAARSLASSEPRLSIGAVARATGFSPDTLRVWQKRYGFPILRRRVVPLIAEVGEGWSNGDLGIHNEHFFSERLEDVLRAVRLPFERSASGPRILLAAFAGETHGLGLQIAALLAAVSGMTPHV